MKKRRRNVLRIVGIIFVLLFLTGIAAWYRMSTDTTDKSIVDYITSPDNMNKGNTKTIWCSVITEVEDGHILLADRGSDSANIYDLDISNVPITYKNGENKIENGMDVTITYSGVLIDSYPTQFSDIEEIVVHSDVMDNRASFYLKVLNDLWETDMGLNDNITEMGVDLTKVHLEASKKAAIIWAFGRQHGIEAMHGTYEDFVKQGYIDDENKIWHNGCLFSITLLEDYNEVLKFSAEKWVSGTGAYFFEDCTAIQDESGKYSDYTIGAASIS